MKSFVFISIRVIDFKMRPSIKKNVVLHRSMQFIGAPIRFPGDIKRLLSYQYMLFELQ